MDFKQLLVNRFTIHKIFSRKDLKNNPEVEPYSEDAKDICKLLGEGLETLQERILKAANQKKRMFQLDIEDSLDGSFWHHVKSILKTDKKTFITHANNIAGKAATAHDKGNIPGGLLLVIDTLDYIQFRFCK